MRPICCPSIQGSSYPNSLWANNVNPTRRFSDKAMERGLSSSKNHQKMLARSVLTVFNPEFTRTLERASPYLIYSAINLHANNITQIPAVILLCALVTLLYSVANSSTSLTVGN